MSGIGLDLLDIERLERALERRPRLAQRLFSEQELEYAARHARPARHLAARFCAKEAVVKALALEVWDPHDVEVVGTGGPPVVRLTGRARDNEIDDQRVAARLTMMAASQLLVFVNPRRRR